MRPVARRIDLVLAISGVEQVAIGVSPFGDGGVTLLSWVKILVVNFEVVALAVLMAAEVVYVDFVAEFAEILSKLRLVVGLVWLRRER